MNDNSTHQFRSNEDYPTDMIGPFQPLPFPNPTWSQCHRSYNMLIYDPQHQPLPNEVRADDILISSSVDDEKEEKRAYWLQKTLQKAIYGSVRYARGLKQRRDGTWEATTERFAIKEMSWRMINRQRNRSSERRMAEDPLKEVSAMQFIHKWWKEDDDGRKRSRTTMTMTTTTDEERQRSKYESVMEDMVQMNVMLPIEILSDNVNLYTVMPFCNGGEMFDLLQEEERFTENQARYWMDHILNGLETLQKAGICHRDMSLENLIVHNQSCLIIDLGQCLRVPYHPPSDDDDNNSLTTLQRRRRNRCLMPHQGTHGKTRYVPPETSYHHESFDGFTIDLWAVGVTLFMMLTGYPPWEYPMTPPDSKFDFITGGNLRELLLHWKLGLTEDCMDFLQCLLRKDPKRRLGLEQVKCHCWMVDGVREPPENDDDEDEDEGL